MCVCVRDTDMRLSNCTTFLSSSIWYSQEESTISDIDNAL